MESARNAESEPACAQPGTASSKKFACRDCYFCQLCSDSRCNSCRTARAAANRPGMSISEQILMYDKINANDPFLRKK